MKCIKIQFTLGLECEAYQIIDSNMCVIGYASLDGNLIELPEITESKVVDGNMIDYFGEQPVVIVNIIPEPEIIPEELLNNI